MKTVIKKTILFLTLSLLCNTPTITATSIAQPWNIQEVSDFLERALQPDGGYIEDNMVIISDAGHGNLAAFIEEMRVGYKITSMPFLAYALILAAKHGIKRALLLKIKRTLKHIPDPVWQAALERSRSNSTVVEAHTEEVFYYEDQEGGQHEVDVSVDVRVEDSVFTGPMTAPGA
jgi:hypothetical protein